MILYGGHDGTRHLSDTHIFDLENLVWSSLLTEGPCPVPRDSHVAVVHSNSMYIFGGKAVLSNCLTASSCHYYTKSYGCCCHVPFYILRKYWDSHGGSTRAAAATELCSAGKMVCVASSLLFWSFDLLSHPLSCFCRIVMYL